MFHHTESDVTYGAPRICEGLRYQNIDTTERAVAKVLVEHGIAGITPRTFVLKTTISDIEAVSPQDRVNRQFILSWLNAV